MAKEMPHGVSDELTDVVSEVLCAPGHASSPALGICPARADTVPSKVSSPASESSPRSPRGARSPLPVPRPRMGDTAVVKPDAAGSEPETIVRASDKFDALEAVQMAAATDTDSTHASSDAKPEPLPDLGPLRRFPSVAALDRHELPTASPPGKARPRRVDLDDEEKTQVCPAAVIEGLLHSEDSKTVVWKPGRPGSVDTRAIDLLMAERAQLMEDVGHEDVTVAYNVNAVDPGAVDATSTDESEVTQPRGMAPVLPRRGESRWLLGVTVAAVACIGAALAFRAPIQQSIRGLKSDFMRGTGLVRGEGAPVQAKVAPVSTLINVSVTVSPGEASLAIDGSPVPNPYVVQRTADSSLHQISASAPGFVSLQRDVQLDRDLTVVLALAPASRAEPAVGALLNNSASPVAKPKTASHVELGAAKSVAAKAACSPPYEIDSAGIKTYKPECI